MTSLGGGSECTDRQSFLTSTLPAPVHLPLYVGENGGLSLGNASRHDDRFRAHKLPA
jgi:hypothetical protein